VTHPPPPSIARRLGLPGLALAALSFGWLGSASGLPLESGLLVAVAALAGGTACRFMRRSATREISWVPFVAGLGLLSLLTPLTFLAELMAGLGGIAILLSLADDPDRPPGGLARSVPTIALPAAAVGIAWSGGILLPPGAAPIGVAAASLALALTAVAFLTGRPDLFDREEAPTS